MAENAEETQKVRHRMEKDVYSVLLSFKDGATVKMLERRMDEVLGYTYHNKYYKGGVHDMEQLLMEHPNIQCVGGRTFRIIPTEECFDLAELVSKQKDGRRNDKLGSMPTRHRRLGSGSSLGFRPPKGLGGLRPLSAFNGNSSTSSFGSCRPLMSISFGADSPDSVPIPDKNSVQRPLRRPALTPSTFEKPVPFGCPPQEIRHSKPPSLVPSIKEFSENSKQMMTAVHPKSVHLSELSELYKKEFGVSVDPLQLFSKSWKMLIQTTFKDWLEIDEFGEVKMKIGTSGSRNSSRPPTPTLPNGIASRGFSFEVQSIKNSIEKVNNNMNELSLNTQKVPPSPRPESSCSIKASSLIEKSRGYLKYDESDMRNLKLATKSDEISRRIHEALEAFPYLRRGFLNRRTYGGNRRSNHYYSKLVKSKNCTTSPIFPDSPPEPLPFSLPFWQKSLQNLRISSEVPENSKQTSPSKTPESPPTSSEKKPFVVKIRRTVTKLPPMSKGSGASIPRPRPFIRPSDLIKSDFPEDDDWW